MQMLLAVYFVPLILGMKDAMVIDTPDALLVGDLKRAQDLREVIKQLDLKGYRRYLK